MKLDNLPPQEAEAPAGVPGPASPIGEQFLPGVTGLYGIVTAAFPEEPQRAWRIVGCETGYKYDNSLIGRAGEVSIWQIHPIHFWRFNKARLRADVAYATHVARVLYDEAGGSFRPWSCSRLVG